MIRSTHRSFGKRDFLAWAQGREGHYELKEHHVVMMTGGTKAHARITQGIARALDRRLDPEHWSVMTADLAVEIGEDVRYPDVVVELLDNDADALSTSRPVFLAEVLSPSSLTLDLEVKAREYMSLPSLEIYLVAAQDEPRVWLWLRSAKDGSKERRFSQEPLEVSGQNALVRLDAFGFDLPLSDIYRYVRRS
ncbi:MAG TPA: Uma2 family endonuclease [Beijerinckiaceae bacterium]|nr:Uma2 family endonuclease [Beijerinckiaceae bacterium]